MRWKEIIEGYKRHVVDPRDVAATPYDSRITGQRLADLQDTHGREEWRGPHEGKEIGLMLAGKKPAALIADVEFDDYEPYIKSGQLIWKKFDNDGNAIVALPGYEKRIDHIIRVIERRKAANPLEVNYDVFDIKLGLLLGIPKEQIKKFLEN